MPTKAFRGSHDDNGDNDNNSFFPTEMMFAAMAGIVVLGFACFCLWKLAKKYPNAFKTACPCLRTGEMTQIKPESHSSYAPPEGYNN